MKGRFVTASQVAFDHLPEPVRARLARIVRGRDGLRPLWKRREAPDLPRALLAFAGGLALAFGALKAPELAAGDGPPRLAASTLAVLALVYGAAAAIFALGLRRLLPAVLFPVPDGIYVLPRELLTANAGVLGRVPLASLQSVTGTHFSVGARYQRGQVVLHFADGRRVEALFTTAAEAEAFAASLARHRAALAAAIRAGDAEAVARLDPLAGCDGPEAAAAKSGPRFASAAKALRALPLALALVGALLGGVRVARQSAAIEARAFDAAAAKDTVEGWKAYLKTSPDETRARLVRTERLPIAELRESPSLGDLLAKRAPDEAASVTAERERLAAERWSAVDKKLEEAAKTPEAKTRARAFAAELRAGGITQFALVTKAPDISAITEESQLMALLARFAQADSEGDAGAPSAGTVEPPAGFFREGHHLDTVRNSVTYAVGNLFPGRTVVAASEEGAAPGRRELDVVVTQIMEADGLARIDGKYFVRPRIRVGLDLRTDPAKPPLHLEVALALPSRGKISIETDGPGKSYRDKSVYQALDEQLFAGFSDAVAKAFAE